LVPVRFAIEAALIPTNGAPVLRHGFTFESSARWSFSLIGCTIRSVVVS
jgi:hypothetical protein